jgi:hypothetical protein
MNGRFEMVAQYLINYITGSSFFIQRFLHADTIKHVQEQSQRIAHSHSSARRISLLLELGMRYYQFTQAELLITQQDSKSFAHYFHNKHFS